MRSHAIQRVLADKDDRAGIGSFADLRRACQFELAAHRDEIAAEVDKLCALSRQINLDILAKHLRCVVCDGPMTPARMSRRYCSPRCRQRAYRARAATA
jgi:hypothetical protein